MSALRGRRYGRPPVSAALVAAGAAVVVCQNRVRQVEADLVGAFAKHVLGLATIVNPVHPEVFFALPSAPGAAPAWIGVVVTIECTSAWLIGPMLAIAGLITMGHRLRLRAVLAAAGVAAAVFLLTNVARLSLIVVATHEWGVANGFTPTHQLYGSVISVLGVCIGVALFIVTAARLSRPPEPDPAGA